MDNKNWIVEITKWLIGTVGLGFAGYYINYEIQKADLRIKRMEADTQLLAVVTKDVIEKTTNDSLEFRYLSFINTFITSSEVKDGVIFRIGELQTLMELKAESAFVQSTNKQQKKVEREISDSEKKMLKDNEERLRGGDQEVSIDKLVKNEAKIANNIPSIDSSYIGKLNLVQKTITPKIIKESNEFYALVGDPTTKWCKRGYYVEYGGLIRIGVNSLTSRSITVNVKRINTKDEVPPIIKSKLELSVGEVQTIEVEDYRYEVSLKHIGAAGKNPFTKAAYISVATYRKGQM